MVSHVDSRLRLPEYEFQFHHSASCATSLPNCLNCKMDQLDKKAYVKKIGEYLAQHKFNRS